MKIPLVFLDFGNWSPSFQHTIAERIVAASKQQLQFKGNVRYELVSNYLDNEDNDLVCLSAPRMPHVSQHTIVLFFEQYTNNEPELLLTFHRPSNHPVLYKHSREGKLLESCSRGLWGKSCTTTSSDHSVCLQTGKTLYRRQDYCKLSVLNYFLIFGKRGCLKKFFHNRSVTRENMYVIPEEEALIIRHPSQEILVNTYVNTQIQS